MSTTSAGLGIRLQSPVLNRAEGRAKALSDATIRRRIGWIWILLLLNVLTFVSGPQDAIPLPSSLGKVITQGSLFVALFIAFSINRRLAIRANLFLLLFSALAIIATIGSLHGHFGLGSDIRALRFILFLAVLWLLTPWWGRTDLLFCKWHLRAMAGVLGVVLLGLAIAPGKSFAQGGGGRLGGSLWPIAPTGVGHFAAVFVGLVVVLWFSGLVKTVPAAVGAVLGTTMLLLTHTRTALIAMLIGILVAGLSLFLTRQRVRKAFAVTIVIAAFLALALTPSLGSWFDRGQTSQTVSGLSGRTTVWSSMEAQPRGEVNQLFGYGMSNDSFQGLSIDSSWLATYQTAGIVGDVINGLVLLTLLIIALLSPRGPGRAIALFLVIYCAISSFIETGLGEPSTYMLDLSVVMSVLMAPLNMRSDELVSLA